MKAKTKNQVFMKIIYRLFGAVLALYPAAASAHVKWFAEAEGQARDYRLSDGPVLGWIIAAAVVVAVGYVLDKRLAVPEKLRIKLESWVSAALSAVTIGSGLSLLAFSMYGFLFAPTLPASGAADSVMLGLQVLAGLMLALGVYTRAGGALLLILFLLGVWHYGAVEMADTLEMVGLGLFAILVGRPKWALVPDRSQGGPGGWTEYGLPLLRVFTGLNLVILAFSEKFSDPALGADFLSRNNWNFVSGLGVTDYWFIFSAGAMEALLGVFLILGLVTRLTTLALAGFLLTTLILLGSVELVGHLPHFSIAAALLAVGAGSRLKLGK